MKRVLFIIFFSSLLFPINAQKSFSKYDDVFRKYSKRFFGPAFDWKLFKAQGIAESGLSPEAISQVGAKGIMQLMPSTFSEIQSSNPELTDINDPEWNIAAGIKYDRMIWTSWKEIEDNKEKQRFTFGSYNAGRGTIMKAQSKAKDKNLDQNSWENIRQIAPEVPRWRHEETINYVSRIDSFHVMLTKERQKLKFSK
ncbi:MAG: transglycosylase SLT domain-containing protein [Ignavibacteriales bacterium]|nr:transglycosylase SLT domain-containing protein [Ignavibacteriales bacterium]